MKFLTFILGLYLLAISVLPCSDVHNGCNNTPAQIEITQGHSHRADHNDICSPFCICSCCSTAVSFTFPAFSLKEPKPVFAKIQKIPIRDCNFVSNYYSNIWQPPKINA